MFMFYKCLKLAIPAAPAQLVCQHKNNGCHSYPDPSPSHWRFSLFSVFVSQILLVHINAAQVCPFNTWDDVFV